MIFKNTIMRQYCLWRLRLYTPSGSHLYKSNKTFVTESFDVRSLKYYSEYRSDQ